MSTGVVLTVSALNRYIKSVFEMDANLQTVYLKGEISNFKNHYSTGHLYMTIKDEQSQLKAVMFKSAAQRLRFMPEDSMSVIIRGRISVYEKTGEYQIYIDDMQPDGTGALAIAFEQLKKKLEAEGLFNPEHKKLIPEYPERVGIVTSETGAAVRDIINVINRRYPLAEIILYPVLVQGTGASSQIAAAIRYFNENKNADVLIVGRGGGSIEDLWAFNEEIVVRAVYNSSIPLISAVGHETDFTLSDFAADLRAPTPSAAAELAVPDIADIKNTLLSYCKRLSVCSNSKLNSLESALEKNDLLLQKHSPKIVVENYLLRIDSLNSDIETKVKHKLEYCSMSLSDNAARLEALNPLKILARGYSAAIKNNVTVRSKTQFEIGDCFDLLLSDGKVKCEVIDNGEN